MAHPLDSARERLKRADENIRNLELEVSEFLATLPEIDFKGENPEWSKQDRRTYEDLRTYVLSQPVPSRFKVLAGEIVHHMRSAFDHLAWQLSSPEARNRIRPRIEFPVFDAPPKCCGLRRNKDMSRYCRKVEGIESPSALARIEDLQPYKSVDPKSHPLWLIHDMDLTDKHRELVMVRHNARLQLDAFSNVAVQQYPFEIKPRSIRPLGPPEFKGKLCVSITFPEVGDGRPQQVIATLKQLLSFAAESIESFAGEFSSERGAPGSAPRSRR